MLRFSIFCLDHWEPNGKADIASMCSETTRANCEWDKKCKFAKQGLYPKTDEQAEEQFTHCREYFVTVNQQGIGELEMTG